MSNTPSDIPDFLAEWRSQRPRPRAILCDIDDTLCTQFDQPILTACRVIAAVDRSIEIHYVTARPEQSRKGTEDFLLAQGLPGWRNLHFCPGWQSSRTHKTEVMARLARQYAVIVSIGDHDEDEAASHAAGVSFVRIREDNLEEAWAEVVRLIDSSSADPQGSDRA